MDDATILAEQNGRLETENAALKKNVATLERALERAKSHGRWVDLFRGAVAWVAAVLPSALVLGLIVKVVLTPHKVDHCYVGKVDGIWGLWGNVEWGTDDLVVSESKLEELHPKVPVTIDEFVDAAKKIGCPLQGPR